MTHKLVTHNTRAHTHTPKQTKSRLQGRCKVPAGKSRALGASSALAAWHPPAVEKWFMCWGFAGVFDDRIKSFTRLERLPS